jgi:hypothetical protein
MGYPEFRPLAVVVSSDRANDAAGGTNAAVAASNANFLILFRLRLYLVRKTPFSLF